MAKKIPPDAFDYYFSLGPARSYQAVAEKFRVSKRAVTDLAKRESWQARILEVESKARQASDQKKVETLQVVKERHLQALRLVLGKGIEALRQIVITEPGDAIRAIGLAVRETRIELGEPSERTAISIEDTIRREYERWMTSEPEETPKPDETPKETLEDGEEPE
jgi:hypothetical protein